MIDKETSMIPRVIHYCWFGGKPLPRHAKKCIASWESLCPDYEIRRWDEFNFDVMQHPFVASAYEAKAWAFVSDWARLKIIHQEGGIYLDTDVELVKPLDSLLDVKCYIGVEQSKHLCTTGLGFGAVKESPVVRAMLDEYDGVVFRQEDAKTMACPYLNDRVIRRLGYNGDGSGPVEHLKDVSVYPCRYLDPLTPGDTQNLMHNDTISIHLYGNSWGSRSERMRRTLFNAIGVERVDSLKKKLKR